MTHPPAQTAIAGDISARAVWFWCLALYAVYMGAAWFLPEVLQGPARHPVTGEPNWEFGLLETTQNIFLAVALVMSGVMCARARPLLLQVWLGLIFLGLLFLLGEETSWGQHYFRWQTGEWFAFNDQNETNLHNSADGWLDQKPRALLQVGMIVGAIIHPLLKLARKGRGLIDNPWWLAPTIVCLAPTLISLLAGAPKAIDKLGLLAIDLQFYRASEMEECFMYLFFVVYLLSLGARLRFRSTKHG
jgi:hypothetical protein